MHDRSRSGVPLGPPVSHWHQPLTSCTDGTLATTLLSEPFAVSPCADPSDERDARCLLDVFSPCGPGRSLVLRGRCRGFAMARQPAGNCLVWRQLLHAVHGGLRRGGRVGAVAPRGDRFCCGDCGQRGADLNRARSLCARSPRCEFRQWWSSRTSSRRDRTARMWLFGGRSPILGARGRRCRSK